MRVPVVGTISIRHLGVTHGYGKNIKVGNIPLNRHEHFKIGTILEYYWQVKRRLLLWMGRLQRYNRSYPAVQLDTFYISSERESYIWGFLRMSIWPFSIPLEWRVTFLSAMCSSALPTSGGNSPPLYASHKKYFWSQQKN